MSKGTVSVKSSEPLMKLWHYMFTTVPLKAFSDQVCTRHACFSLWKLLVFIFGFSVLETMEKLSELNTFQVKKKLEYLPQYWIDKRSN